MTVHIQVTGYKVSLLSMDDVNSQVWSLTVEWRGEDTWAVKHLSRCLSSDGEWHYEPLPSSRTDEWLAEHRFTYDEAMALACERVGDLVINDLKVVDGKLVAA